MDDITSELGRAYREWKQGEKDKNKAKDKFFTAIDEELSSHLSPQKIVKIEADNEEGARRIAQRRYHKHKILDISPCEECGEGVWKVMYEEDPSLNGFSYVNHEDGMVYSRQMVEGSAMLDDDALREENPKLWDEITETVEITRMKSLEDMTEDQVRAIQPYLYMPKPSVKLGAPRKAKAEELDERDPE